MKEYRITLSNDQERTLHHLTEAYSFFDETECLQTLLISLMSKAFTQLPDRVLCEKDRLKKRLARQDQELEWLRHMMWLVNEDEIKQAKLKAALAAALSDTDHYADDQLDDEIPF